MGGGSSVLYALFGDDGFEAISTRVGGGGAYASAGGAASDDKGVYIVFDEVGCQVCSKECTGIFFV